MKYVFDISFNRKISKEYILHTTDFIPHAKARSRKALTLMWILFLKVTKGAKSEHSAAA